MIKFERLYKYSELLLWIIATSIFLMTSVFNWIVGRYIILPVLHVPLDKSCDGIL